jgi:hypothetical protein
MQTEDLFCNTADKARINFDAASLAYLLDRVRLVVALRSFLR